jgi:hypothetical protein
MLIAVASYRSSTPLVCAAAGNARAETIATPQNKAMPSS